MLDDLFVLSRKYLEAKAELYQRSFLQNKCFKHRLSILIGQRGVGKTTIMIQYLLNQVQGDMLSRSILYVPTDHFLLGDLSLYEIAEEFFQFGGQVIAFDEIHKYNNWSKELKSIYDTFPSLKIVVSGSSALEVHRGTHDLTRRSIVTRVFGLSLREYLELNLGVSLSSYGLKEIINNHEVIAKDILRVLAGKKRKILSEFHEYLQVGYYPYFLELNDKAAYYMTIEQNFHAAIESDLPAIHSSLTGASIRKIKQLLVFVSAEVPFTPNWRKLKGLLDIGDERTLKTYFKYLEDAGLVRLVMSASKKMRKIEVPEKIYLNNTNQLFAISMNRQNIGTVRETFFVNMLAESSAITIPQNGDFLVAEKFTFEVGGKNKDFSQIQNVNNAYFACDGVEGSAGKKIPLWLFGFLY